MGITAGFRSAEIPYPAKDRYVDDFIPVGGEFVIVT